MVSDAGQAFLVVSGGALAKLLIGAWIRWSTQQRFRLIGKVSALFLFPIKSCKGIPLQKAEATRLGLRHEQVTDRHWLIVTSDGDFITQRQMPRMVLISTSFHGNMLHLDAPNMPTLRIPKNPPIIRSKIMTCRVWADTLEGLDCGNEAATWVSKFLETNGLRIVHSSATMTKRDSSEFVKPSGCGFPALPGDLCAYPDYCAYMVTNSESLKAVNDRLDQPVTVYNFRPNIVIDAKQAFEEDNWKELRIGDHVYLRCLDPCTRCLLTTVHPDTGEKDKAKQPLETLKQFRCFPQYGEDPLFGVNVALDYPGQISVGDSVYALI